MSGENKTLIILSPGFPADEDDSTCMPFPQLFVKSLKQSNPALDIIVFSFQYPHTRKPYNWNNVLVVPFNGRNRGKWSRLLLWNSVRRKLKKIIPGNDIYGVLSLWLGECALIGNYISRKYRLKHFTWLLGQDAREDNRYFRLIRPEPFSLIALSDFIADEFERNYGTRPVHTIAPGLDENHFNSIFTTRDFDVLGAGSLIALKQYDIFIEMIAGLREKYPGIKAVICGDGPERGKLEQLITLNDLSGNIKLYGKLKHANVIDLMQRSKVFLHPSSYEGFATVLSEALYAGAHFIGFCKPMKTIFKQQYAVNSKEEMLSVLNKILANNSLQHERILINSIETTCGKILSLYH